MNYRDTRISGPYGPSILALAEDWLALLPSGLAMLNLRSIGGRKNVTDTQTDRHADLYIQIAR